MTVLQILCIICIVYNMYYEIKNMNGNEIIITFLVRNVKIEKEIKEGFIRYLIFFALKAEILLDKGNSVKL